MQTKMKLVDTVLMHIPSVTVAFIYPYRCGQTVCAHLVEVEPLAIPQNISEAALRAAVNFVGVCVQHAFIAGRGIISESIEVL